MYCIQIQKTIILLKKGKPFWIIDGLLGKYLLLFKFISYDKSLQFNTTVYFFNNLCTPNKFKYSLIFHTSELKYFT